MQTIEEYDEFCRLHDRAIIVHTGKLVGFVRGYEVGR